MGWLLSLKFGGSLMSDFYLGPHATRFCYHTGLKTIGLPNDLTGFFNKTFAALDKYFHWITGSINHEELHGILLKEENLETCAKLDKLGYNDATGYISRS